MFNFTKALSVGKNGVSANEHILVRMNKQKFNRTKI